MDLECFKYQDGSILSLSTKIKMDPEYYVKTGINKAFTKMLMMSRELFTPNIIVHACIYFDWGKIMSRNWGDDINYHLLKKLTHKNVIPYDQSSLANRKHKTCHMCIGSTITFNHVDETIVWGAGVIDPSKPLKHKPIKVLAVRGPLSRKYLLDHGVECPEIYGDPALLMPQVYMPKSEKKFKLGIIPHYDDFDNPALDHLKRDSSIHFIRLEGYKKWTDVLDQIASCEYIVSSSLHGIIISEAYGIPNLWVDISGKLIGGHFKFHDFFLSIGVDRKEAFVITEKTCKQDLLDTEANYIPGHIDVSKLIEVSPFKLYF